MIITQHDNCLLDFKSLKSGIQGIKTIEIHRQFPEAQHPNWQRILQVNADPLTLHQIRYFINNIK